VEIEFIGRAKDDFQYWKKAGNKTIQKRISKLLIDISHTPYSGIGKPEKLKHELQGYWSRRINDEHRVVYTVKGDKIKVISLRYHYL
jgi:toxin YoeB